MPPRYFVFCIFYFVLSATIVLSFPKITITPEHIVNIRNVTDPHISPDSQKVLFVVHSFPDSLTPEAIRQGDIWIADLEDKHPAVPLITTADDAYSPRWSPDGSSFAFMKQTSDGTYQIFLKTWGEDNIRQLTGHPVGIVDFQWHPDASLIFYTAYDTTRSTVNMNNRFSCSAAPPPARLFRMNLKSGAGVALTPADKQVSSFRLSPSGSKVALCISESAAPDRIFYHSMLAVQNADGSGYRELAPIEGDLIMSIAMGNIRWSPDASMITYFSRTGALYTMLPTLIQTNGHDKRQLARAYRGTIWELDWFCSGDALLVSAQQGMQGIIGILDVTTEKITPVTETGIAWSWPDNRDLDAACSRIVFKDAAFNRPEDLWMISLEDSQRIQLTDFNPWAGQLAFGEEETITWKSPDGLNMEGLLIRPAGFVKGRKYPLVTLVHGGPEWAWWSGWQMSWHDWGQMLASNGFAVFLPNPRGSLGYGWQFAEANQNDWGKGDYNDIMSGIDYLVAEGIADPERLGIGGWSYGGYMSAWATAQSQRFKAAVTGAGFYDLYSFYGTTPFISVFNAYFGTTAYRCPDCYRNVSPLTCINNITTPTLILHGEADSGVPAGQARAYHRALLLNGTEVACHIYPGEGHIFRMRESQLHSLSRILTWYKEHLR